MEVKPRIIIDYETPKGESPIREWLDSLDGMITARIEARLRRVALGNMGDVKPVGNGVSELRLVFGSDIEKAQEYWADFKRRNHV